jgi:flagellar FliJ protein
MKRFRFDLEKLLELRAFAEREAEIALAKAIGEASDLSRRLTLLAEERTETASARFAPGRSAADILSCERYILRLDRQKEALLAALAKAELAVQAARENFTAARRERKVLDKLKDKRRAEHRDEALAAETAALDDISGGALARAALT